MQYDEVPEGEIFYIEKSYHYPKIKRGQGHMDLRDGCKNSHGNPAWEVELADHAVLDEASREILAYFTETGQRFH